ncbi:DoxX family protein [Kitasatospora sp. NPDC101801]|uniref:DoxX family protein n=1 Tax=Kitasatospora sp. NPDC101801 TaxID=3364103 RepID=UPI0037F738A7
MQIAHLVVTVLAAAMSGFSAYSLLSRADWVVQAMVEYRVPRTWWTPLGLAKAAGALGLLAGLVLPVVGLAATVGLALYYLGAVVTVIRARSYAHVPFPLVYLAPAVVAYGLGLAA